MKLTVSLQLKLRSQRVIVKSLQTNRIYTPTEFVQNRKYSNRLYMFEEVNK